MNFEEVAVQNESPQSEEQANGIDGLPRGTPNASSRAELVEQSPVGDNDEKKMKGKKRKTKESYVCRICNKQLSCGQALGGHMNGHAEVRSREKMVYYKKIYLKYIQTQSPTLNPREHVSEISSFPIANFNQPAEPPQQMEPSQALYNTYPSPANLQGSLMANNGTYNMQPPQQMETSQALYNTYPSPADLQGSLMANNGTCNMQPPQQMEPSQALYNSYPLPPDSEEFNWPPDSEEFNWPQASTGNSDSSGGTTRWIPNMPNQRYTCNEIGTATYEPASYPYTDPSISELTPQYSVDPNAQNGTSPFTCVAGF